MEDLTFKDVIILLNINPSDQVDLDYIKHNFRVLAKKYHPDTAIDEWYKDGAAFRRVKEAYDYATNNIDGLIIYLKRTKAPAPNQVKPHQENENPAYNRPAKDRSKYYAIKISDSAPYNIEKCIWEAVDSSIIDYVYYDSNRKYFFVLFKTNRQEAYCYINVEYDAYNEYLNSPSKGRFINYDIKARYSCVKFDYPRYNSWTPT